MDRVWADKVQRAHGAPWRCAWLLGLALPLCGAVRAGDTPLVPLDLPATRDTDSNRPSPLNWRDVREPRGPHSYEGRLKHLVGFQWESVSALNGAILPGAELVDQVVFQQMNKEGRRGAQIATHRAVKEYLLELTDLDRVLDGVTFGRRGRESVSGGDRGLGFNVHFTHGLPKVEMRYPLGGGTLKFGLGAQGAVQVEYNASGLARVGVGYDGDNRYRLFTRVGF